jgi:hypothetical protein
LARENPHPDQQELNSGFIELFKTNRIDFQFDENGLLIFKPRDRRAGY